MQRAFGLNEAISVLPRISDAEIDVMEIVWNDNPIGTNEITDRLTGDGERSPKTIQTLIRRLVDKGALSAEKRGRQFYYTPAIDRDDFIDSQKKRFTDRFFGGDVTLLVSSFIGDGKITRKELEEIRSIIDSAEKDI